MRDPVPPPAQTRYQRGDPGTGRSADQPDAARTGRRQPVCLRPSGVRTRNTVERCINRLKQWRGVATRYEKTATVYLAGLHIAGTFLWSAR
ncbi:transposase [Streptomyces sp. HF10]|nr:transposase [Streptomyces sp. HF10]